MIAWIVALIVLAGVALLWYQNNETNKAFDALRKENDKADRVIKALKP